MLRNQTLTGAKALRSYTGFVGPLGPGSFAQGSPHFWPNVIPATWFHRSAYILCARCKATNKRSEWQTPNALASFPLGSGKDIAVWKENFDLIQYDLLETEDGIQRALSHRRRDAACPLFFR